MDSKPDPTVPTSSPVSPIPPISEKKEDEISSLPLVVSHEEIKPTEKSDEDLHPTSEKKSGLTAGLVISALVILISLPVAVYYISQQQAVTEQRKKAVTPPYPMAQGPEGTLKTAEADFANWVAQKLGFTTPPKMVNGKWVFTDNSGNIVKPVTVTGGLCTASGCTGTPPGGMKTVYATMEEAIADMIRLGVKQTVQFDGLNGEFKSFGGENPPNNPTNPPNNPTNPPGENTPTSTPITTPTETPSQTPTITLTPTITGTPSVTSTPTETPTQTPTGTPVITSTPTVTPTPVPSCNDVCSSDAQCLNGTTCINVNDVLRCRNLSCPNESSCRCPGVTSTPTPTGTYIASTLTATPYTMVSNGTPTPTPVPKLPVSGIGFPVMGMTVTIGAILLILLGIAL